MQEHGNPAKPTFPIPPAVASEGDGDLASVELSARRTGMSFQRTRLSAERTLMSVIRTSLSLISFGFTISQFFRTLEEKQIVKASRAPTRFGGALVYLGVGILAVGMVYHLLFMRALRRERDVMADQGLIHAESGFPRSFTFAIALFVLALGVAAIASFALHIGPFY
jgi:putative membrane protein